MISPPLPATLRPAPARPSEPDLPIQRGAEREFPTSIVLLRRCLWVYIVLWIIEGALRKWILPGLATPLLVVRDPLLLFMFYLALSNGVFPKGMLVTSIVVLGIIAVLVSTAATNTPMMIQLYGLRASYVHLLLIFLVPKVFDRGDVRRAGKWLLLAAGPMALLVLLQFLAGPHSKLNAGAGGAANSMIESAYGHIRPSGTFSFTNGLAGFSAMAAVYFLYHVLEVRVYPRLIWLAAAPAVLVLILLSGSRTAAGMVFLIMATVAFVSVVQRRYRTAAIKIGAVVGALVFVAGSFAVFQQGLAVFAYRFGNSTDVQVGFVGRFFEAFKAPFQLADQAPALGYGLGMGTNVAAGLLYGYGVITLSEGELGRNIMESGPYLGGVYLVLRAIIAAYIGWKALGTLRREGQPLPLLVFSACAVDLLLGQFSQPTELGYATIAGGLCLAANRAPDRASEPVEPPPAAAPDPTQRIAVRGRSALAEQLHTADEPAVSPENPEKSPF